jgi:hypothetical protein
MEDIDDLLLVRAELILLIRELEATGCDVNKAYWQLQKVEDAIEQWVSANESN